MKKPSTLPVVLSWQAMRLLRILSKRGLHGNTPSEVAERFIYEALVARVKAKEITL